VIEAHGGRTWVEPSEAGGERGSQVGATFVFTLPMVEPG
jgi:signal transduction histidine kinase